VRRQVATFDDVIQHDAVVVDDLRLSNPTGTPPPGWLDGVESV